MIAQLSYLFTIARIHVRRELLVGKTMAELQTTIECEDGYSVCGMPIDDHDEVECETEEEALPLWGDDEEG